MKFRKLTKKINQSIENVINFLEVNSHMSMMILMRSQGA